MSLTLVTHPGSESGEVELSLGEPERLGKDSDQWTVSIYGKKHRRFVTFMYESEDSAKGARKELSATLIDVLSVASD
jgi:hypothetical protein